MQREYTQSQTGETRHGLLRKIKHVTNLYMEMQFGLLERELALLEEKFMEQTVLTFRPAVLCSAGREQNYQYQ
jgi:hypothetical protein